MEDRPVMRIGSKVARVLAEVALAAGIGWLALAAGSSHSVQATAQSNAAAALAGARTPTDAAVFFATEPLTKGCNQVTLTNLPVGGKVGDWVTANVSPSSAAISVWRFDNPSQSYKAMWFNVPQVPVDLPTFPQMVDGFFVCVGSDATAP
jgi:hypothetical protein